MRSYTFIEYIKVIGISTLNARWFYGNPWRSIKKTKKYQEKQIKKLLIYAYKNTSLYYNKYKSAGVHPDDFKHLEDLNKFPTITKNEMIAHFSLNTTTEGTNNIKYINSVSSGSSGKIITIIHNPLDTWSYALGRFRILNLLKNYKPWDKSLYIYTSPYPAKSYFGLYPSYFISTLNNLEDTVVKIKKLKPKIISSYPSQMLELVKYFDKKEAQNLKLKLISLGSELSTRSQRDELGKFFNCGVYDEYSSEELGWVAGECEKKQYHISEDISYIEILKLESDEKSTTGEIVGTNLHNFAMPFIRYRQGDLGIISENKECSCGRKFRVLDSFLGRENDTFKFFNGKTLPPAYLLDSVYALLLNEKIDLLDFCLIQESQTDVKLQIVAGKNFSETDSLKIKYSLEKLIPAKIKVEAVSSKKLYKTTSGKKNPIISKINI